MVRTRKRREEACADLVRMRKQREEACADVVRMRKRWEEDCADAFWTSVREEGCVWYTIWQ